MKKTRSGLTEAQVHRLHQRALSGESVKSLAAEIGVRTSSLSRLLRRRFDFVPRPAQWEEATIKLPSDPLEIGYIAALVDAAGYISRASKYGSWSVKVLMTDPAATEWLATLGAGSYYVRTRARRRTTYEWSLARQEDVRIFLERIGPHLKIKGERARTALDEIAAKRTKRAVRSPRSP